MEQLANDERSWCHDVCPLCYFFDVCTVDGVLGRHYRVNPSFQDVVALERSRHGPGVLGTCWPILTLLFEKEKVLCNLPVTN